MVTSSYPRYPGDIAGTFILALAQAITELGHQVSVVAPADPTATHSETGPIPVTRFRYSPVPGIQPMGYGKALENDQRLRFSAYACAPPYLISGVWQLLKTAQRFSADVIHAHWVLPNGPVGLLASTIARKPLVTTLHGSDIFLAKRSPILGWLAGKSLAGSRAVTACSADLATDATFFTSRVRNGEVSERGGASGFFSKDSTKRLDAGERVFITDIDVKDDRIRVGMLTAETSQVQVKGSTKQTRYRGYVDFEFDKTLMASMPANDALKAIEAIFVPADKVAGTKTKTLELDQTIQEVEAILGKPATVVKLGARTIYNYPSMKIVFTDGRVSDVE